MPVWRRCFARVIIGAIYLVLAARRRLTWAEEGAGARCGEGMIGMDKHEARPRGDSPPRSPRAASRTEVSAPLSARFQTSWARVLMPLLLTAGLVVYVELTRRAGYRAPIPFLALYMSVVLAAHLAGRWPGVISAACGAGYIAFASTVPFGPPALTGGAFQTILGAVLFLVTGWVLGSSSDRRRALISKLETHEHALEDEVLRQTEHLAAANRRLVHSEARWQDFAAASVDYFWEQDAELRFANVQRPGGESDRDIAPKIGDIIGQTRWSAWKADPVNDPYWGQHYSTLMARQPFRDFVYEVFAEDGSKRWMSTSGVPFFDEDGEFIGYRGVSTDITEKVVLENQLRRNERIEALGQLTGGIAHDFNNLLSIINGYAELIERGVDPSKASPWAAEIKTAAMRGSSLVNRLMTFGRHLRMTPAPVDIEASLLDLANMLRRTLGEQIELTVRADPELWPAMVDSAQLDSAIVNLAINARDAMDGEGQLELHASNYQADGQFVGTSALHLPAGDYVRLAVRDTGPGIPSEYLERVFEPFFTTKPIGKGTGLGLSMVHAFAVQCGGGVSVASDASDDGEGATFTLYLPRSLEASHPPSAGSGAPGRAATSYRVLLVEDDDSLRAMAETMLRQQGHEVLNAKDAVVGLEVLGGESRIDLLFTDLVLPGGMSGTELARAAQKLRPGLPVLFSTGYAREGDDVPAGAPLLGKPYRSADLAQRVQELCSGKTVSERNGGSDA